jgi:ribulose-5-phosphate 4-epimerase/fuculose-1-phosphate aldolase
MSATLRKQFCDAGLSLFQRGLVGGTAGNMSVRGKEGILMTPTGSSMGELTPGDLSVLDLDGNHVAGPAPTKESFLHLAFYRARSDVTAVIHTHSTYSTAAACLAEADPADVLPPLTPYYVMRVGRLPLVPYFQPGDPAMGNAVAGLARDHAAVLLANHGPVVAGAGLAKTIAVLEELEEAAKLFFVLRGSRVRILTPEQQAPLRG